jgi:hypothetical protein
MTGSSIDPNGNTCSLEKPTSECLARKIFRQSIFISLKVVLYRILVELPMSIRIRCILWFAIAKLNTKVSVCGRDHCKVNIQEPDDLGLTFCRLRRFLH